MNSTLNKIKELREKAAQGEWDAINRNGDWNITGDYDYIAVSSYDGIPEICERDAQYIVALHNAFPSLIQEHEALLRFVEAVRNMDYQRPALLNGFRYEEQENNGVVYLREQRNAALQALDKELKQ